jgi:tetratricopeptide (TPR) repeat protein/DNA-binding CsgD family transcriptional regulator
METNNILIPPYDDRLLTINGIKFTHREIDVITFIFHTRGSSKIASLLSISTRTVETHTANVMRKMDTNSREGIIDFLEKHNHINLIKKHYRILLLQFNFYRVLREVNLLIKDKGIHCYLVCDSQQHTQSLFIKSLKTHLNLCGINVSLIEQGDVHHQNSFLNIGNSSSNDRLIYVFSPGFVTSLPNEDAEQICAVNKMLPSHFVNSGNVTYVFYNANVPPTFSPSLKTKSIFFESRNTYYLYFFNLLKKLISQVDLSLIVSKFDCRQELHSEITEKETIIKDNSFKSQRSFLSIAKKEITKLISISTIVLVSLGVALYVTNYDIGIGLAKAESKINRSIRSDLIVPSENTYLARPQIMKKIEEGLKGNDGIQVVAIVGIGGAGKSTIARRFALQQKNKVVWEISASTRESLMASFESLAYTLCTSEQERKVLQTLQNIKNNVEKDEKIISFVKEKLKASSNWFLIYDNVERFTDIQKFFPYDSNVWGNGKIIVTTSNGNTKNNNLINNFIYIGELSPKEKLNLFIKIMCTEKNQKFTPAQEEEANKFLNEIPPFPLDVSIAGYYLKSTNISYEKYLKRLNEDNKDFQNIQADVVKEASGYTKTRNNIITLSAIQLIDTHKDFRDLLVYSSLLDYRNIPNALLSTLKGDTVVDNFIYNLKKYSLITSESFDNSHSTFSLHKNAQEIILAYLSKSLELTPESSLIQTISNNLETYMVKAIDKEDFSRMKLLVPHCEAFLNRDDLLNPETKSSIGGALGCIYYYLRHNVKAKKLLERNLENLTQIYGENHEKKALLLIYLGNFYRSVGDYSKAKALLTQSLDIYSKHPNYLRSARVLGYLGSVYRDLGNYKVSKDLLEQSLNIYKKHAPEEIGHAWILAKLGSVYTILGDYEKAKVLLEDSLNIYKIQSDDYVGVSWVLGYLGNLYVLLGDYEKAESLLKQSQLIYRKYFAEDHVFVGADLASLGKVYIQTGDYQKAKTLLKKSLAIFEMNFGKKHVDTAHVMRLLGEAYCLEGDMDVAEDWLNKALLIYQQRDYPEGYICLENLADLYLKKANQANSESDHKQEQIFKNQTVEYLNQALRIVKNSFQENSPHIQRINTKLKTLTT